MNSSRRRQLMFTPGFVKEKHRYQAPPLSSPLLHPPSLKLWLTGRRRRKSNNCPRTKQECKCAAVPLSSRHAWRNGAAVLLLLCLLFARAVLAQTTISDDFNDGNDTLPTPWTH